jgi:hypothetical protein
MKTLPPGIAPFIFASTFPGNSWWKFDHLANPLLSAQSTTAAQDANMIILSIRAHVEVPLIHRRWIESWAERRKRGKAALVALIGAPSISDSHSSATVKYLQTVARSAKMDFFDHSFELPPTPAPTSGEAPVDTAPIVFEPEKNLLHKMPIPRWGINE